jgi:hypothetical protein
VPSKLAKQTTAMMITKIITTIIMTMVMEMIVKKLSMIRLYKRLKHGRVKLKNND